MHVRPALALDPFFPARDQRSHGLLGRIERAFPDGVLMLAFLGLLLSHPDSLLNDPDTLWHVEVGRWILAHRAVPWTDPFSHTFAGAPWIAKEWLSQMLLFAAHAQAGWWGVVSLAALAIATTFTMVHAFLRARLSPLMALATTLASALLACPHFLARPHILVLPVVVAWIMGLVSTLERRASPPFALALLMIPWANMHGSFPLGLVLAAVLAGEGILLAPAEERLGRLARWTAFLALATACTIVSPYGWHAILVPLSMSGNAETLRFISEWQPLRLDLVGGLALALLAIVVAILGQAPRQHLFRLIAVGMLAYLMVRHVRFISLFAIIAPLLAARPLADRLRPPLWLFPPLDENLMRMSRLGAFVVLGVTVSVLALVMRPQPVDRYAPDAALAFALAHGASGPVYNDYDFGGFLIAHGIPTFVDGRTDQLFLGDFLPALDSALKNPAPHAFADLIADHDARWAIVRTASRASLQLHGVSGWKQVYADDIATIFIMTDRARPTLARR